MSLLSTTEPPTPTRRGRLSLLACLGLLHLVGAVEVCGQTTTLVSSFAFQQAYDDNITLRPNNEIHSYLWELRPGIRLVHERRRSNWELEYRPAVRDYSLESQATTIDHSLSLRADLIPGRRWNVGLTHHLLRSQVPFFVLPEELEASVPGDLLTGDNRSLLPPASRTTTQRSSVLLSYRLARTSGLTWGGDYWQERASSDQGLAASWRKGLYTQYEKRYSTNRQFALRYGLQWFGFNRQGDDFESRVQSHSLLLFHQSQLTPTTQLDFFVGPQYSRISGVAPVPVSFGLFLSTVNVGIHEAQLSLAAGAVFAKKIGQKGFFSLSVLRRVSDGGTFVGAVIENSIEVALRRELTRHLQLSLSAYGGQNRNLTPGLSSDSLRSTGGSVRLSYRLQRQLALLLDYFYARQSRIPGALATLTGSHNRVSLGLRYELPTFAIAR